MPDKKHIHTEKFRRCVAECERRKDGPRNCYAVCTVSLGYEESILKGSRK